MQTGWYIIDDRWFKLMICSRVFSLLIYVGEAFVSNKKKKIAEANNSNVLPCCVNGSQSHRCKYL